MIIEEKKLLEQARNNLKHYQSILDDYDQNGMLFQQGFDKNGKPVTQVEVAERSIEYYKKQIEELSHFEEGAI